MTTVSDLAKLRHWMRLMNSFCDYVHFGESKAAAVCRLLFILCDLFSRNDSFLGEFRLFWADRCCLCKIKESLTFADSIF